MSKRRRRVSAGSQKQSEMLNCGQHMPLECEAEKAVNRPIFRGEREALQSKLGPSRCSHARSPLKSREAKPPQKSDMVKQPTLTHRRVYSLKPLTSLCGKCTTCCTSNRATESNLHRHCQNRFRELPYLQCTLRASQVHSGKESTFQCRRPKRCIFYLQIGKMPWCRK